MFRARIRNHVGMNGDYVFGYGSLVNPATHGYAEMHPARLSGWRREWRHAAGRRVAFLTVVRSAPDQIDGLVARVEPHDWPDLDLREKSYLKEPTLDVSPAPAGTTILYHAPPDLHPPAPEPLPILLSYLDVVVQGFFRNFGEAGVAGFFNTTDGRDAPILNDRKDPRYARHQELAWDERTLTDTWVSQLGGRLV